MIGGYCMFKEHDQSLAVEDEMILWRYMDFSKFVNMLTTDCIWFNRIDKFEDKYECTYPSANKIKRKEIYGDTTPIPQEIYDAIEGYGKNRLFVSCFHCNEYESSAMWKIYSKDAGVAIKTTAKRLKDCFNNEERDIEITKVCYIDFDKDFMPEGNVFYWGMHKRQSFEYEKEVRCFFLNQDTIIDVPGVYITVDFAKLVEEIYISPDAPSYMQFTVENLLKRFGYNIPVIKSQLYELNR